MSCSDLMMIEITPSLTVGLLPRMLVARSLSTDERHYVTRLARRRRGLGAVADNGATSFS